MYHASVESYTLSKTIMSNKQRMKLHLINAFLHAIFNIIERNKLNERIIRESQYSKINYFLLRIKK